MPLAVAERGVDSRVFCDAFVSATHTSNGLLARRLGWDDQVPGDAGSFIKELNITRLEEVLDESRSLYEPSSYQQSIGRYPDDRLPGAPEAAEELTDMVRIGQLGALTQLWADKLEGVEKSLGNLQELQRSDEQRSPRQQAVKQMLEEVRSKRRAMGNYEYKQMMVGFNHAFRSAVLDHNLKKSELRRLLLAANFGNLSTAISEESGIAIEIAAYKAIKRRFEQTGLEDYDLRFGTPAEDMLGGDIIIRLDGKVVYLDAKTKAPKKYWNGPIEERGFEIEGPTSRKARNGSGAMGYDAKLTIWPNDKSDSVTEIFEPKNVFKQRLGLALDLVFAKHLN